MSENTETPQQKVTSRPLTPEEQALFKVSWVSREREEAAEHQKQKDLIKEAVTEALKDAINQLVPELRKVFLKDDYRLTRAR